MPSPKRRPTQRPATAAPAVSDLIAVARQLLPEAHRQAKRGRPRLLAVCARIILSARRLKHATDKQFLGGDDAADLDALN